jgi:hypothetical protein
VTKQDRARLARWLAWWAADFAHAVERSLARLARLEKELAARRRRRAP